MVKYFVVTLGVVSALSLPFWETADGDERTRPDSLPKVIGEDKICPVCGMYPVRFLKFQTQIVFKDGRYHAFDGCKDMFKALLDMKKYDKVHARGDVSKIWVKDFNSGTWFEAQTAHFVVGSSLMGPMGLELIPFAVHGEAMKFHRERGGKIVSFTEVNLELLNRLGRKKMPMDHGGMSMDHGGMENKP